MKQITKIATVLALSALPAMAEDTPTQPRNPELSEGAELLSEGMKLFFRGLMAELDPAAEGWDKMVDWLGDLSLYETPEQLPNGDIIIRRKVPLTPEDGDAAEGDETEL